MLTRDPAQARKDAAVRFPENVLKDQDRAESENLDDWVQLKRITLIDNRGKRSLKMAVWKRRPANEKRIAGRNRLNTACRLTI
jgi:hypothetical protein